MEKNPTDEIVIWSKDVWQEISLWYCYVACCCLAGNQLVVLLSDLLLSGKKSADGT